MSALQFLLGQIITITFVAWFFLGGPWVVVPVALAVILAFPVDEAAGDDWSRRIAKSEFFYKALLHAQLPAVAFVTFLFAYFLSDWTFLGSAVNEARDRTTTASLIGAAAFMGLGIYSVVAINIAHELVHRTDRASVLIARWLLSFSAETAFSIEHVYGHHVDVGTEKDLVTAARGESFWPYFLKILFGRIRNAWRIEKRFLSKRGQPVWSLRNRVVTGQLMSLVWLTLYVAAAGWLGLAAFVAMALVAKLNLELSNYIEHYGLVRLPGTPVAPRHSWNSARRTSNLLLFNLPRHADHHVKPGKNYWELDAREDAPQLPHGHFVMVFIALIPPLFRDVMRGPLADWERRLATPQELALVAERAVAPA